MSSLLIANNTEIMMFELGVEELFVPSTSPFDAIIMSKFIVSFRFFDDEWIDIMPSRLDYKKYRGSSGEVHPFYGGKSIVFSVNGSTLVEKSEALFVEIRVRREISRYFEADSHVMEVGRVLVNVDSLLNGIVEELRVRRELGDYLRLVHERDPISRSHKDKYILNDAEIVESKPPHLQIYMRLSHLGNSIVTEIDRTFTDPTFPFYTQEETNLGPMYECRELASSEKPNSEMPIFSMLKSRHLECVCTDEQKYKILLGEGTKNEGTTTREDKEMGEDKEKKKKKEKKIKKKEVKEKSTLTEAETADKAIGTIDVEKKAEKDGKGSKKDERASKQKDMTYEKWISLIRSKRRGAGGTVGIVDRKKTCETAPAKTAGLCAPCYSMDICITKPCDSPCLPIPTCPPPVCCYN